MNGWVEAGRRLQPHAIQVTAGKRAPILPRDHSVRIEHWYYLEYKRVAENFGAPAGAAQEVYEPLVQMNIQIQKVSALV
jgi:hypothetical protein